MKKLLTTAAILAALTTGAANADTTFDYSYTFSSGDVFSGSLQGNLDPTGTYITNISNVQAFLDGVQFLNDTATGSLDVVAWNTTTESWDDSITPVVSTNAALNNFAFADTDLAVNTLWSNGFLFVNDANLGGQTVFGVNSNITDGNGNALSAIDSPAGTWSITAVPVPASLPLMISGLGLLAAAARRRLQA